MVTALLKAGRTKILGTTFVLVCLIIAGDWYTGTRITLEVLYLIPMMLASVVLRRWEMAVLALFCAVSRATFQAPEHRSELIIAGSAYFATGLFVSELVRNRDLIVQHWSKLQTEHNLRELAEERARLLVECSPAAILTVDAQGMVIASNHAADRLFLIARDTTMQGRHIGRYLPLLAEALQVRSDNDSLRASAQSQGYRENGELFMADTWFSTYKTPGRTSQDSTTSLAAIVVDSSEAIREREEQGLKQLLDSNRIMAAAISHEVLNLSGALKHFCDHLAETHALKNDKDLAGMVGLIEGIQSMATVNLHPATEVLDQDIDLRPLLDNLRIVIEPHWREIDGQVRWELPQKMPLVIADPHGLFQVMLNLAHNSHRAVQEKQERILDIGVRVDSAKVLIEFGDSGPGIPNPEILFRPFQKGSHGNGLGLHVSRTIMRNFGGELRYESPSESARFVVELLVSAEEGAGPERLIT